MNTKCKVLVMLFLFTMVCAFDVSAQNDIVDSPRETKIKADVSMKHETVQKLMKLARGVQIESLRGLKGFFVIIEPNVAKEGLSIYKIKKDVELRLKKAGIKVLTEIEMVKEPGKPYLYIYVKSTKNELELYAYYIEAGLGQGVFLERDNKILVPAIGWKTGITGIVGANEIANSIRNHIKELVDKFINDYLSVNPK